MKKSIKFLAIFIVITSIAISCKKVDGPVPSQKVYLTAHTWYITKYNSTTIDPDNCSGNLAVQFSGAGKFYVIQNCSSPQAQGSYTLNGSTIDLDGEEWTILSLDASSFSFKDGSGSTYICEAR